MSDTEGSECSVCRWTRNEMDRIRAKMAKAEKFMSIAEKTFSSSFMPSFDTEPSYGTNEGTLWNVWKQLYEALKEYREQKGPNEYPHG